MQQRNWIAGRWGTLTVFLAVLIAVVLVGAPVYEQIQDPLAACREQFAATDSARFALLPPGWQCIQPDGTSRTLSIAVEAPW